jgi:DnaJ-domain-containing protein 1
MVDMTSDVDISLSEEQRGAVRRMCASNAQGATLVEQVADAEQLMMALGVHPVQDGQGFATLGPVPFWNRSQS